MLSAHQGKIIVAVSAAASLGALFYIMKSRRKSQIVISKEKFFPLRQNISGLSDPQNQNASVESAPRADGEESHPEGPNIGFGSDPSWLSKGASAKTDLLHQGNMKGGKLLVILVGLPGRGKIKYLFIFSWATVLFILISTR